MTIESVGSELVPSHMVDPNLRALRYLIAVAEHLSFRRAAGSLSIRQSAISRQIQKLEETIGVALFDRHPGGLRLTLAGRSFAFPAGLARLGSGEAGGK